MKSRSIIHTDHSNNSIVKGLGINKSHGSSLCLVNEVGEPIFCVSEERFTRVKLQIGMPHYSFKHVNGNYDLEGTKFAIGRLDALRRIAREIEYYWNGRKHNLFTIPISERLAEVAKIWFRKKLKRDRTFHRLSINTKYFMGRDLDYGFDHHLCHMASAFYCSGFDDAVVISVDGVGDLLSAVVGYGKETELNVEHKYFFHEHYAGQAYEIVTAMLGFHPDRHPGKVTGLAAYVEPNPKLVNDLDKWLKAQYKHGAKENWFYLIHQLSREEENIEKLRKLRETRFGEWSREEISSTIQYILERDVIGLIKKHVPEPRGKNITLAGGVFANVKLNQRIKGLGFDRIFIQPAMGDDGTGLGAAILSANKLKLFESNKLKDVYLGPEFSTEQIRTALNEASLKYEQIVNGDFHLERRLAKLLNEGKIIARFQGRMEFGPRALGNRSILYHAKDPSVNDWLNKQLKRSEFMPFAPVTLAEHAHECYKNFEGAEHTAQFMTITFEVTDKMKRKSPACVHIDGTARPQIINEEINPSYYWTLKFYHELSGIPSIINTSFNLHEEPIVCTPKEAVKSYLASNLDVLAIGDFLVINDNGEARRREKKVMR